MSASQSKQALIAGLACLLTACASPTERFSIVMLPDTQFYSEKHPEIFHAQTQWVAEHVESENIRFVTHVGDVVQNWDQSEAEWNVAEEAMGRLDGIVPWGVAIGNHDYDLGQDGQPSREASAFLKRFGPQRFDRRDWFGGSHPNGINTYQLFEAGLRSFLILHLEADVPDDVIDWAEGVLEAHPELPAIVTTHIYISDKIGGRTQAAYMGGEGANSGEEIWQKFIRKNPQIFMVLCGHWDTVGGEWKQVSMNDARQEVIEVLADFQTRENGGNGWLRLIQFDEAESKVWFKTYSPSLDRHEDDNNSEFFFNVNFEERF